MPETFAFPSDRSTIERFRELAPQIHSALEGAAQRAGNDFLVAYIDGYRNLLNVLVDQSAQLLDWIQPEKPAALPTPPRKSETDPGVARRAKLAAGRLKQRYEVAELRATIQSNRDAGFPTDASERDLDRMREDRVRLFGEDNYIFGLAKTHTLSAAEWRELADVYRALAAEAQSWTRRLGSESADAGRIAALKTRFDVAIASCGHALTHDADMDWLVSLQPPPALKSDQNDDLATVATVLRAIQGACTEGSPAARGPSGADRARLKADVARAKGRIARADARGRRDDDAALELRRLQTRHRLEFHEDGYVFGFSATHRLEPDAWEDLARAYEDLADAMELGTGSDAAAAQAQNAVDQLRAAIAPIGRALRHDDDADDLEDELRLRAPRRQEGIDPLAPFLEELASLQDDPTDLALRILAVGVRPSDPRLREPFLEWTEDLDDPALEPLVRELRLEIGRRQEAEAESESEAPDPAYLAMLEKVRDLTRGKSLLMVGGTNREDTRRAIEQELGLAELRWPDSDEHKTKPGAFDSHVDHADIVVKNRFCRRGYQRALERAKAQGKPTVALTGGYNVRQLVRGIAEALHL